MTINASQNENKIIISPIGRLDSATSGEFMEFIDANFTEEFSELEIDFSGVDFISSKGLRVIVSQHKNLNGRKMVLTHCNESVHEVFRLSGLLNILDIK